MIHSPADIVKLVAERGIVPFFAGEVEGFSLEEETPPEYWFPDNTIEGVWEWKGEVILEGDCAYGKFYRQKACFISMDFFPDFVNVRRSRHTLSADEARVLQTLREHGSLLSKELKRLCGYVKPRPAAGRHPMEKVWEKETRQVAGRRAQQTGGSPRATFDALMARLQMAGQVVTADFEYQYDRKGERYGWGVARYCTPEDFFGAERLRCPRTPEASAERLQAHLRQLLPHATEKQIEKIIY